MSFAFTTEELIRRYGITGVIYFPRYEHTPPLHERTAAFLSSVGLPHSEQFMTRTEGDSIRLREKFSAEDGKLPDECDSWLELGWFHHMVLALDPSNGKVYAFPEGTPLDEYEQLHRDVESLVHTLMAFEDFATACEAGSDLDALEEQFKNTITSFDPVPFSDEDSQWSRIVEGVLEESWTA
ncbi:SUKH-4 family immunity protein [Streptomyces sp. NPDC005963]|uniref:SUKH-4 family immunity protein n=1 Tax=Streptomyces sp. NPDC005963 TaxID=3156721 RepID=UPI0033D495D2